MEQVDGGGEVEEGKEGMLSLPYEVKSKEMLSIVDGAGNGALTVFFEVEEGTWG